MQEPPTFVALTEGFEGEVHDALEIPASAARVPGALDVGVKIIAGRPRQGVARLVDASGGSRPITIVGFAYWHFAHPEQHDLADFYLLVTGVACTAVRAGHRVVQDPVPCDA